MTGGSDSRATSETGGAADPLASDTRLLTTVTLLTQADCALCEHAKDVLRRVQQDPRSPVRLTVVEVDLSSGQGRRLATDAGLLFAPGILLDGRPFAHGRLSERKLRRALDRPPNTAG